MTYKRYEKYKESKISYLPNVPYDWKVKKLKYVLSNIQTGTTPSTKEQEYFDGEIQWFGPGDFDGKKALLNSKKTITLKAINDKESKLFNKDMVVIVGIGATLGKVAKLGVNSSFNQQITGLEVNNKYNSDYLYYWLLDSKDRINKIANYTTLPIINNEFLNNLAIFVPTLEEQKEIANFLDKKTAEIDSLIQDKESLMELLKEQRQAIINETVTKGLDKNVKMKDSGIEWIGQIPEKWRIRKLKYNCYMKGRIGWQGLKQSEFINEGPFLITGMNFKDGKINWDEVYHISEERYYEAPEIQLKVGDVLITKDGTIGKLLFIDYLPGKASLNSHLLVMRCKNNDFTPKFLYYSLHSEYFKKYVEQVKTGTTFFGITQEAMYSFPLILPTVDEQHEIVSKIECDIKNIDNLIEDVVGGINNLREYKQSLISEAVTGKIDVREY